MKKTTFARRTSLWLTLMAITCAPLAAQTGLGVPLDLINIIKSTLVLFMAIKLIGNNREAIADFFGHIFHRSAVKKEG